jgi:hypothetical protein
MPSMLDQLQGEIANFLDRHMVNPQRYQAELEEIAAQMAAARQLAGVR